MASGSGHRATIAVIPSVHRRSMSEADLHGVADLIKSVVDTSSNVSPSPLSPLGRSSRDWDWDWAWKKEVGHYIQLSSITCHQRRRRPFPKMSLSTGAVVKQSALSYWLSTIRYSVEEEDDDENLSVFHRKQSMSESKEKPTTPTCQGRCPTSEELLNSISPEAAKLLREILSGSCFSFEDLERREGISRRKKSSCSCQLEFGNSNRKKSASTGVLAWQNILHWAECDIADADVDGCEDEVEESNSVNLSHGQGLEHCNEDGEVRDVTLVKE